LFAEARDHLRERVGIAGWLSFRQRLGRPFGALLANGGLDEAVAALRTFSLIEQGTIVDECDATIATDTIRVHRLVRQIAAARREGDAREQVRRALIEALAAFYPRGVFNDPTTWPRARRLDALALAQVGSHSEPTSGAEISSSYLLDQLASYRVVALAAYAPARLLCERALAIREKTFGLDHPGTAASLNNLAWLLQEQGELAAARPLFKRALAIYE
jgi:hypothetical protein